MSSNAISDSRRTHFTGIARSQPVSHVFVPPLRSAIGSLVREQSRTDLRVISCMRCVSQKSQPTTRTGMTNGFEKSVRIYVAASNRRTATTFIIEMSQPGVGYRKTRTTASKEDCRTMRTSLKIRGLRTSSLRKNFTFLAAVLRTFPIDFRTGTAPTFAKRGRRTNARFQMTS